MGTREVCLAEYSQTYTCLANATNASSHSYFMETCTGEDDTEDWQIGFGVGLGCFGSIGINLGNNLQSLGLIVRTAELSAHIAKLERDGYLLLRDLLPRRGLPPTIGAARRRRIQFDHIGERICAFARLVGCLPFRRRGRSS